MAAHSSQAGLASYRHTPVTAEERRITAVSKLVLTEERVHELERALIETELSLFSAREERDRLLYEVARSRGITEAEARQTYIREVAS